MASIFDMVFGSGTGAISPPVTASASPAPSASSPYSSVVSGYKLPGGSSTYLPFSSGPVANSDPGFYMPGATGTPVKTTAVSGSMPKVGGQFAYNVGTSMNAPDMQLPYSPVFGGVPTNPAVNAIASATSGGNKGPWPTAFEIFWNESMRPVASAPGLPPKPPAAGPFTGKAAGYPWAPLGWQDQLGGMLTRSGEAPPSNNVTVRGGTPAVPPPLNSFRGTATGNTYNVGQRYTSGGYIVEAMPDGSFRRVGKDPNFQPRQATLDSAARLNSWRDSSRTSSGDSRGPGDSDAGSLQPRAITESSRSKTLY